MRERGGALDGLDRRELESAGAGAEALARIILARNGLPLRVIPMAWVNMGNTDKEMPEKVEFSSGLAGNQAACRRLRCFGAGCRSRLGPLTKGLPRSKKRSSLSAARVMPMRTLLPMPATG